MRSRSNKGLGFITKVVIVILVIIGILALIVWLIISSISPTPMIGVNGVSINPSTIKQSQSSTLSFTIKNNDASSGHNVTVEFNTTSSVIFNINGNNLTYGIDGLQYYQIMLTSSQQSTYSFRVFGVVPVGASSTTYSIPLHFSYQNGTKFDTETVDLTVNL